MLNCALLRLLTLWRLHSRRAADEGGQTLAEYSLIITIIAVGTVLIAVLVFRETLIDAFDAGTSCLDGTC